MGNEDQSVWDKKDRRIARMSCIKSAVELIATDPETCKRHEHDDLAKMAIRTARILELYIYEE